MNKFIQIDAHGEIIAYLKCDLDAIQPTLDGVYYKIGTVDNLPDLAFDFSKKRYFFDVNTGKLTIEDLKNET